MRLLALLCVLCLPLARYYVARDAHDLAEAKSQRARLGEEVAELREQQRELELTATATPPHTHAHPFPNSEAEEDAAGYALLGAHPPPAGGGGVAAHGHAAGQPETRTVGVVAPPGVGEEEDEPDLSDYEAAGSVDGARLDDVLG